MRDIAAEGAVVDRLGAETEKCQRRFQPIKTGQRCTKCAKLRSNRAKVSNIFSKQDVTAAVRCHTVQVRTFSVKKHESDQLFARSLTSRLVWNWCYAQSYRTICVYVGWSGWITIVLFDCRERERRAGWARMTFNVRESGTVRCQFMSLSQQECSVLTETQVRQGSFSALCPLVWTSVIVKSIKNWNPGAAPGRHDATDEEGKESHWELRQHSMFTRVLRLH